MDVHDELAALRQQTSSQLKARYAQVFGEKARSSNKPWLIRRIAWRLQANREGDLSERARQRARELANDADLRLRPPKKDRPAPGANGNQNNGFRRDPRLPIDGCITRVYKGEQFLVQVTDRGFEYQNQIYKSLSAVAKEITGTHTNGYLFFRLGKHAQTRTHSQGEPL